MGDSGILDRRAPRAPTIFLQGEDYFKSKLDDRFKSTLQNVLQEAKFDCTFTVLAREKSNIPSGRGLRIRRTVVNGVECSWSPDGKEAILLTVQTPKAFVDSPDALKNRMDEAIRRLSSPSEPVEAQNNQKEVAMNTQQANGSTTQADPAQPQPPKEDELSVRLRKYMNTHGIGEKEVARRAGSRSDTIGKLLKGETPGGAAVRKVEAVLLGKTIERGQDESSPEFDETTESFIKRILSIANNPEIESLLLTKLYHRISQATTNALAKRIIENLFREALSLEAGEDERLTALIELHKIVVDEVMKPASTK